MFARFNCTPRLSNYKDISISTPTSGISSCFNLSLHNPALHLLNASLQACYIFTHLCVFVSHYVCFFRRFYDVIKQNINVTTSGISSCFNLSLHNPALHLLNASLQACYIFTHVCVFFSHYVCFLRRFYDVIKQNINVTIAFICTCVRTVVSDSVCILWEV